MQIPKNQSNVGELNTNDRVRVYYLTNYNESLCHPKITRNRKKRKRKM